jgi:phenylpropionate dioxygenase-like ring-hydroxylating dioxygenase large terminal subunit
MRTTTSPDPGSDVLARSWYPVARAEDVAPGPRRARLFDRELVVARVGGRLVVASAACPHRGGALWQGCVVERPQGGCLQCPYHGWRFDADGRCRHIPSAPLDFPAPARSDLTVIESTEQNGWVWGRLEPGPDRTPPAWPALDHPNLRRLWLTPFDLSTSAGRQIENFLDISHFPFVHDASFGNPEDQQVGDLHVEHRPGGLHLCYRYEAMNPPDSGLPGPTITRSMTYDLALPFAASLELAYPDGERHLIVNVAVPLGPEDVRVFGASARTFDLDRPADEINAYDLAIYEQDRRVLEEVRPRALPLDPAAEAHVPADRLTVAFRRALRDMGIPR